MRPTLTPLHRRIACQSRLFSSLPEGVRVDRLGLVEVIEAVTEFLGPQTTSSSSARLQDDRRDPS